MADALAPPTLTAPARLRTWQQALLSLYWLGTSAHWTAIIITLLPLQAELIGGSEFKGATLGIILAAGACVSIVVALLVGAVSDRIRTPWGRRKPFLVIGTIGNVLGLLALAFIPSIPTALVPYVLAFIWIELCNNVATAPYAALIPDVVPREQRGAASGWLALMTMLGNVIGGSIGLLLPIIGSITGAYLLLALILLVGMFGTILTIQEPNSPALSPFRWRTFLRGLLNPFQSPNFAWVFWTRFLVTMGTFMVFGFLLYYMEDVIGGGDQAHIYSFFGIALATGAAAANAFFILAALVGAIVSSLVAGVFSDRHGRKPMVYLSGGVQGLVALLFIFNARFEGAVLLGFIFGIGYGAYQAVDWALASDVLPSADDYAKDMGVWHIALTLPQVLATPIGGMLLDRFQRIDRIGGNPHPTLGYTVIFAFALIFFVLGTLLVHQIKAVR